MSNVPSTEQKQHKFDALQNGIKWMSFILWNTFVKM